MTKARVLLTSTHHAFGDGRIDRLNQIEDAVCELNEDMLANALIDDEGLDGNHPAAKEDAAFFQNFFNALLHLDHFTSVISMRYREGEKIILARPHRYWGMIFYEGRRVARFTHDVNREHRPYTFIHEWPGGNVDEVFSWSTGEWRLFFLQRIKSVMEATKTSAEEVATEAKAAVAHADQVLVTLLASA